jgi:hypothetical protein
MFCLRAALVSATAVTCRSLCCVAGQNVARVSSIDLRPQPTTPVCKRGLRYASPNHPYSDQKMSDYKVVQRGGLHTLDFRLFFQTKEGQPVSPFHDIPLV